MDVIPYTREKHGKEIVHWLSNRKLDQSLLFDYSDKTFVVVWGTELIAIAGLDFGKKIACLIGMMTNPKASLCLRSRAVSILIEKIKQEAKDMGFDVLMTCSKTRGIINRAKKHGFNETSQIMMSADLRR